ncbi:hypothetical protein NBO_1100g0001 [Nosema bombycis CQ1]|uniref:Uncharacterized protein n=1 Tax=Nosema bombycis (strain CQ1 / CVCC 102059) TaxID=578461 RepID=R0M0H7_NOSB1|nr:hypothetical protein NBO_1100g0001 [Nosema bombycis CQ1]|eukprot:EOB11529.1 hypothetical protein NBO_1100g0001 [Nosema bombycis CQ1]
MNIYNSIFRPTDTKKERFFNWKVPRMSSTYNFFIIDMLFITWLITDRRVEKQKAGLYIWTTQLFIVNLMNILDCLGVRPLLILNLCAIFPEFYNYLNLCRLELEVMYI